MVSMRILRSVLAAGLAMAAVRMWGQDVAAGDAKVARGKYLAEEVARCQDCHTPKMDNGNFIKSQWMKGTTMSVTPPPR